VVCEQVVQGAGLAHGHPLTAQVAADLAGLGKPVRSTASRGGRPVEVVQVVMSAARSTHLQAY